MRLWLRLTLTFATVILTAFTSLAFATPSIMIRNNHDLPYHGPITFETNLPDGVYGGQAGTAEVTQGICHAIVHAPGKSKILLTKRDNPPNTTRIPDGAFTARGDNGKLILLHRGKKISEVDVGLVVIPGTDAGTEQALERFQPLSLQFQGDRVLSAKLNSQGYEIQVRMTQYGDGWFDTEATVTRSDDSPKRAYIALVRRVVTSSPDRVRSCYSGLVGDLDEPRSYHRNMTMTHGVDWCSWKSGNLWFAVVNGFTSGLTHEEKQGRWVCANSYYVRESVRKKGDELYFFSRISGPTPEEELSSRGTAASYIPPQKGEPVRIWWRIAVAEHPAPGWQQSQMLVYSGFQRTTHIDRQAVIDLGVPYVEFGTSYFPYSTFCENFDYYRVTGLDREGWWPFSPHLWNHWRDFTPQIQTDLRIIKAMGFDWVRLHHLELLAPLGREKAFDFLDFYMNQSRKLGLKVLVDTTGPPDWLKALVQRYGDVIRRIEIENEILIPGIKPGDPDRWKSCYKAVKEINPDIQVFLTGNCNVGMFDRLLRLGVPFDRCGYHFYQHGAEMDWATPSVALAMAGYARTIGREPTLGEFNWKILTRWSPESRAKEFAKIYSGMLEPRAIPEFMQFHWQETLSVNPRTTRQAIRHYETIHLDRRPKPEAFELMMLIRKYARQDSPARVLPIRIAQMRLSNGKGIAGFTITNRGMRRINLRLAVESFGGIHGKLLCPETFALLPGERRHGEIEVSLPPDALPGTYHFFLRAEYTDGIAYGWGIATNPGHPKFDDPVMPELVQYPQGPNVVAQFDYGRRTTVVFGKEAPALEVEMAYQIFNTLQSATGGDFYLCSVEDLSPNRLAYDNLVLVGTPQTNKMIAAIQQTVLANKGTISLHDAGNGRQWLIITGDTKESVEAAATDFTLRYWKNAKDSAIRIAGMEKGAALGNRATPGDVNPP